MNLNEIYRPITATPFAHNDSYMEYEPCAELKPYIRCFWGTKKAYQGKADTPSFLLVTPDTCMDIIFTMDYTEDCIHNTFCGIDDSSFMSDESIEAGQCISTFAIRFYPWSAVLFSEESMRDVRNSFFDVGYHFSSLKKQLETMLLAVDDIYERIAITESYLLNYIQLKNEHPIVMNAVAEILKNRGNLKIKELERKLHVSSRQMERVFKEYIGVSPKRLSTLVRYQSLWNDVVYKREFNILDEVHQLGYSDQAHLLNDFKRFHTLSLSEAKQYAWKDVAFLQEKESSNDMIERKRSNTYYE